MKLPKKIKLRDRKLWRENAQGLAHHADNLIEVDPRLGGGKSRMNVILHECLHLCFPELGERSVRAVTHRLTTVLWNDRWRRVED
jgi:hypothetical protein